MLAGDKAIFALESEIFTAYERLSFIGLGYFLIHIGGVSYGVRKNDATMLACSFDGVVNRLNSRGEHRFVFAEGQDAATVAEAVDSVMFGMEEVDTLMLHQRWEEVRDLLHERRIVWAPDGDEAFDDRSCVVHVDLGDRVRLIGFRRGEGNSPLLDLREVVLDSNTFYSILEEWRNGFWAEWNKSQKVPMDQA